MSEVITSYKGFDKDLKCRGFQYEIGKEYEEEKADCCHSGFHAVEMPLHVFNHYAPGEMSRYCVVEQSGEIDREDNPEDSKLASTKIKIGAEIGIPGLVKAQFEYVRSRCTNEHNAEPGKPATAGYRGAATAGYRGAATAGDSGAATAGKYGAATAGDSGAATAGSYGAATAGYRGAATAGKYGAATAGYRGAATAGYRGAATAGDSGAATSRGSVSVGKDGVGTARGENAKIRGGIGAIITCAIESKESFDIVTWASGIVDGEKLNPDVWYTVKDGAFIEADNA